MILLIDKSQKDATLVSEILFNMGFLSLAVTPERAPSEISNRFRAVIFLSPERMGSLEEYVPMIRKFSLGSPIFALCRKPYFEGEALFDKVFYDAEISYDLIGDIIEVQTNMKKRRIGSYRAMGIDASVYSDEVTFFDIPLGLTKTETMILRYIAVNFPTRVKPQDILRFAFKSGKCPEIANIRTHISSINKKFVKIAKRQFIVSENRLGYTLAKPPDIFAQKNSTENKITK